jgi:hypothetical protein
LDSPPQATASLKPDPPLDIPRHTGSLPPSCPCRAPSVCHAALFLGSMATRHSSESRRCAGRGDVEPLEHGWRSREEEMRRRSRGEKSSAERSGSIPLCGRTRRRKKGMRRRSHVGRRGGGFGGELASGRECNARTM